jgi:PAS domain-containing protein
MIANTVPLESDDSVRSPGVSWVVTDEYGMLLEASPEAAEMLNLTISGLRWRQLLVFFDGGREHWRQALRAAAGGLMVDREGALRPRDKRPLRIRAEITQAHDWLNSNRVLWIFTELEGHCDSRSDTLQSEGAHL